jgi:hypothetical protein
MERFLIGVMEMVDNGMKPSDAVTCDVPDHVQPKLMSFLGVRSLKQLDRMSEDGLRRLFGPASLAAV